jgi:hypothetical protein
MYAWPVGAHEGMHGLSGVRVRAFRSSTKATFALICAWSERTEKKKKRKIMQAGEHSLHQLRKRRLGRLVSQGLWKRLLGVGQEGVHQKVPLICMIRRLLL